MTKPGRVSLSSDTTYYLKAPPDVAAARLNPLVHFMTCGRTEGRTGFIDDAQATGAPDPLVDRADSKPHRICCVTA